MLWQERGINWNDMPAGFKRGRCCVKRSSMRDVEYVDKRSGETKVAENVARETWQVEVPPVFTQDTVWIGEVLPRANT